MGGVREVALGCRSRAVTASLPHLDEEGRVI